MAGLLGSESGEEAAAHGEAAAPEPQDSASLVGLGGPGRQGAHCGGRRRSRAPPPGNPWSARRSVSARAQM